MSITIHPIKKIPLEYNLGGDYDTTQTVLILGTLASGETIIKNYNRSINVGKTIRFLKMIGGRVTNENETIRVGRGDGPTIPEDGFLEYDGDIFPLSMIIGLVAGLNESCTLRYGHSINADMVDNLVDVLNNNGIDVYNDADTRQIIFRSSPEYPIEIKITSSLSFLKNCLLFFGISSGCCITIREIMLTSGILQKCIQKFDGDILINTPKPEFRPDPVDPRKRIKTTNDDYKREVILRSSAKMQGQIFNIPSDMDMATALMTLAALNRVSICLDNIPLDNATNGFLNFLKSSGMGFEISNRRSVEGLQVGSVSVTGKEIKVRKTAGNTAATLIDKIPFMAIIASKGKGTSVIRGVKELTEVGFDLFGEITSNLAKMGVKCGIMEDGLVIEGTGKLAGADFARFNNPKVGLAFLVASMAAGERCTVENIDNITRHYPDIRVLLEDDLITGAVIKNGENS